MLLYSYMKMHSNSTVYNSRVHCHLVILNKGDLSVVCQQLHMTSLKLLNQFHLSFICCLLAQVERVYIFGSGHMTKMTVMPI